MVTQRLDKLIADGGTYSRRQAKELIRAGRVRVNGATASSGEQRVSEGDTVTLDELPLRNQEYLYIMLNKPAGVLCATRDRDQPTVLDLLPPSLLRKGLFPAGRLDKDTEGFVLITDDGGFAHRILSPRNHVPKTYLVTLDKPAETERLRVAFAAGVELDGGDRCSPALLEEVSGGATPVLRLTIHEGMYHQVKRMFARFGWTVTHLRRTHIGGLALDPDLACGQAREMLHKEVDEICSTFKDNFSDPDES